MNIASKFLEVQDELNKKLAKDWKSKGWRYTDAIFTEATEAFNHLNWEWWRAAGRPIDWDQVKLEIVDVAHFLLSEVLATGNEKEFSKEMTNAFGPGSWPGVGAIHPEALKGQLKWFIKCVIEYDNNDDIQLSSDILPRFFDIIKILNLSIEQFYTLFIGKVCLNQLRWKNGYKIGIYNPTSAPYTEYYIKTWNGVEDNVWLAEYAATLDPNDAEFKTKLETALDAKYAEVYKATWPEK